MRRVFVAGVSTLLGGVLFVGLYPRGSKTADSNWTATSDPVTGESLATSDARFPLIGAPVTDPYERARRKWLEETFGRQVLVPDEIVGSSEDSIEVRVHSEPFTQGTEVSRLDEAARAARAEAETLVVESRVRFRVEGVDPDHLALFFAFSGFVVRLGKPGERSIETFLTYAEAAPRFDCKLPDGLELGRDEYLVRESWKGGGLAKPTDVWLMQRLLVEEQRTAIIYDLLRNCGSEDHARVRFLSGRTTVIGGASGTIVDLHTFYRGQDFPSLFSGFVVGKTESYFRDFIREVKEFARSWRPGDRERAWAAALGLVD
jgi:hypothetical protein